MEAALVAKSHEDYLLAQTGVLGSILISPEILGEVVTLLRPDDFNPGLARDIFCAARDMLLDGEKVDPVTVLNRLGPPDKGRREYVLALMDRTPTAANFREYSAIVRAQARLRDLRMLGSALSETGDMDAARSLTEKINGLLVERTGVRSVSMEEALGRFFERAEAPREYLSWGLSFLDEGLYARPGNFVVLGGRPSDGKTALALRLAYHQSRTKRVGFFSLETDEDTLFDRLFTSVARVSGSKLRKGTLEQEDFDQFVSKTKEIKGHNLHLIQASAMTVGDIQAYSLAQQFDIIYVDYLQLVVASGGTNRTEEVTKISMGLHTMAQKNKTTVVALSQLSRKGKAKSGQMPPPNMGDLRESGQIEQDADIIMLIYKEEPDKLRSRRILQIAKNKEGITGGVALFFDGEYQTFREDTVGVFPLKIRREEPEYKQIHFTELPQDEPVPF